MKPKVYFAADHAGWELKNVLLSYVRDELGYTVFDLGAHDYDESDDFPDFIALAAAKISASPTDRAIILGGSGEGEAMAANRFPQVRATVYYGEPVTKQTDANGDSLSIIESSRLHNDANVLSIGARFLTNDEVKSAVSTWLSQAFSGEPRHVRRIKKIENLF